jgi:hypothetical protein
MHLDPKNWKSKLFELNYTTAKKKMFVLIVTLEEFQGS